MASRDKVQVSKVSQSREEVEAKARALEHLAKLESVGDLRVLLIRSLSKDPEVPVPSQLNEELVNMWGQGQKGDRKSRCVQYALAYLLDIGVDDIDSQRIVLSSRTAYCRNAAHYLAARWESDARPKTWIDQLSVEDQSEWSREKRAYTDDILREQRELGLARDAYDKALGQYTLNTATRRERLFQFLRDRKIDMSQVLKVPKAPIRQLAEELIGSGLQLHPDLLARLQADLEPFEE